nr:immunoglobulin heavy chain junction region [Macaca mulatta]MOY18435.1 immunoglobulin heavy chain junction region [Macaca mulatta]MOY19443.1 immunoglobulin heavy chain junction region [Macaca mulatta]
CARDSSTILDAWGGLDSW